MENMTPTVKGKAQLNFYYISHIKSFVGMAPKRHLTQFQINVLLKAFFSVPVSQLLYYCISSYKKLENKKKRCKNGHRFVFLFPETSVTSKLKTKPTDI